jgi:hypothetical protein
MKFAFPVKHNGVDYEPGQEVPIGVEPVKENALNDMSVAEIRKELIEKYGVEKFPSNKKADLIALLEEKRNESNEDEEDEDESDNSSDDNNSSDNDNLEEDETSNEDENEDEEDGEDLLNTIINED